MKAMVVNQWGEKSVLQTRPDPKPGPGEAVMKVRAAGVGLTLLNMRSGSFGGSAPRSMMMGEKSSPAHATRPAPN